MGTCYWLCEGLNSVLSDLDKIYERGGLARKDYKLVLLYLQACAHVCRRNHRAIESDAIRFLTDYRRQSTVRCGCCLERIPSEKALDLSGLRHLEGRIVEQLRHYYAYFEASCPRCYEAFVEPLLVDQPNRDFIVHCYVFASKGGTR